MASLPSSSYDIRMIQDDTESGSYQNLASITIAAWLIYYKVVTIFEWLEMISENGNYHSVGSIDHYKYMANLP
jgi:hypothetical protein